MVSGRSSLIICTKRSYSTARSKLTKRIGSRFEIEFHVATRTCDIGPRHETGGCDPPAISSQAGSSTLMQCARRHIAPRALQWE
eukprot:scaffold79113_cov33-Tisochrysis_lutea.AAC.2